MPVSHGGQGSQTWRALGRNQAAAIVCNRTFERRGWIHNIGSWSRILTHRAATFAATALAGPPISRTSYLAHVWCHSDASMYSDCQSESLSVASAVAVARRLTASACTVDSLAAGWIRGPPRCAHAQSASSLRHRSHGIRSARFACATTQTTNAAFSDFPSHV